MSRTCMPALAAETERPQLAEPEPIPFLLLRSARGNLAVPIPPNTDPVALGAQVCNLAGPEHHTRSEWCVVRAVNTRTARWPTPEPWAVPATPTE